MALIWSKKSTGMPIEIESGYSRDADRDPGFMSHCILDIDIYRNEPAIIKHSQKTDGEIFRGTRITLVVEGNWTTYKTHIMHYVQQLAIITPYAQIQLSYRCALKFVRLRRCNAIPCGPQAGLRGPTLAVEQEPSRSC
jgi:DNA topoisomerase VI subunit B